MGTPPDHKSVVSTARTLLRPHSGQDALAGKRSTNKHWVWAGSLVAIAALSLAGCGPKPAAPTPAEWRSAGPYGGPIALASRTGDTVWSAGKEGGLWRSDGDAWRAVPAFAKLIVHQIEPAESGLIVRAGAGVSTESSVAPDALLVSGDGANWTVAPILGDVRAVAIAPGGRLFAAVLPTGRPPRDRPDVMRSDDSGMSWQTVGRMPFDEVSTSMRIAFVPGTPDRLVASTYGSLATSDDGGQSWKQGDQHLVDGVVVDPLLPGRLWANDFNGPLWRSVDAGRTAARLADGPPGRVTIATDPLTAGRLWAAADRTLWRSDDAGETWDTDDLPEFVSVVLPGSPPMLFGTRVWRFGPAGWIDSGLTPAPAAVLELALDNANGDLYVLGHGPTRTAPSPVWRSSDSGRTWGPIEGPATGSAVAAYGGVLWLAAGTALWRHDDGGWRAVPADLRIPFMGSMSRPPIRALRADAPGRLAVDVFELLSPRQQVAGVFETRDDWQTFTQVPSIIAGLREAGGVRFGRLQHVQLGGPAGIELSEVLAREDPANGWTVIEPPGAPSGNSADRILLFEPAPDGTLVLLRTRGFGVMDFAGWRSTDLGTTWLPLPPIGRSAFTAAGLDPVGRPVIASGLSPLRLEGDSWQPLGPSLPQPVRFVRFADGVVAAGSAGVWRLEP